MADAPDIRLSCLVVDEHPVVRQGIRALLEQGFREVELLGAASPEAALAESNGRSPDVVLIDPRKAAGDTPDPMTDGLTRDQRFFLSWATVWRRNFTPEELTKRLATDEHALSSFRAIAASSNLPAFAAAFECKAGDPMVRAGEQQVVIW